MRNRKKLKPKVSISKSKLMFSDQHLEIAKSKYVLPKYSLLFSDKLAERYKPIVYSHESLSGPPKAIYYRIVARNQTNELCIEYFFYWVYQYCIGSSHRYDYEPIFVYLRKAEGPNPYLIVNGGFGGPDCNFHKVEIRPRAGRRERFAVHFNEKLSPKEYYPFGKDGNVEYKGCSQRYPLQGGGDLQFYGLHPLFGIRICSNVFSGAKYDLQGIKFNPPLKRLSDRILSQWYFNHYNRREDMPFGHDIADPFRYPHIKFHCSREDLPSPVP
jgi:hypothetical protein